MNREELLRQWKTEEKIAHIHGWDFSHLEGRCLEEPLPWEYRDYVLQYLKPEMKLLDVDTGGGEFMLSLGHPYGNTAVTEGYEPNVALCRQTLTPLGIDVRQADIAKGLPFPDDSFDMVINRHGDLNPREFFRVLKPGGYFISQQVGAENDREFVRLLLRPEPELPFPEQYLEIATRNFQKEGFAVLEGKESFTSMTFTDVGALVWFARILPWEFPDFSVDRCLPQLQEAQRLLERDGCIRGRVHRFLLVARK